MVILMVQHFVPFSPKCIIQLVLYPVGHFRGEEPVRDVWVVDYSMYTYAVSCLAAFRMRHKLVQLWPIIFSRADSPKECRWTLLLNQCEKLVVLLVPILTGPLDLGRVAPELLHKLLSTEVANHVTEVFSGEVGFSWMLVEVDCRLCDQLKSKFHVQNPIWKSWVSCARISCAHRSAAFNHKADSLVSL